MAFEIITENGARFRFESDQYRWQYALVPGYIDIEDIAIVEVYRKTNEEGDEILHKTFAKVIAVGDVDDFSRLIMPRERRFTQCPRCGYLEDANLYGED